jgi:hypothetical protein
MQEGGARRGVRASRPRAGREGPQVPTVPARHHGPPPPAPVFFLPDSGWTPGLPQIRPPAPGGSADGTRTIASPKTSPARRRGLDRHRPEFFAVPARRGRTAASRVFSLSRRTGGFASGHPAAGPGAHPPAGRISRGLRLIMGLMSRSGPRQERAGSCARGGAFLDGSSGDKSPDCDKPPWRAL